MHSEVNRRANLDKAKEALRSGNQRSAAFYLLLAARETLVAARTASGRAKRSMLELADHYKGQAEALLEKAGNQEAEPSPPKKAQKVLVEEKPDPSSPWLLTAAERPNVRLDDVAGMEEVKKVVTQRVLRALERPDLVEKYTLPQSTGMLLYGPPGTGKTFFGFAIAGQLGWPIYYVKADEIVNKWVGDTEKNIAALFRHAKSQQHAIVFIDEVSYFLRTRKGWSAWRDGMVDAFLQEIGSIEPKQNTLLLITTTNVPWALDSAALRAGRLTIKIYVGLPDLAARQRLLEMNVKAVPGADQIVWGDMAGRLEGYSGADVKEVAEMAKLLARDREMDGRPPGGIATEDFMVALQYVKPSVLPGDLREFEKFAKERGHTQT